jgi:hypothetical protein
MGNVDVAVVFLVAIGLYGGFSILWDKRVGFGPEDGSEDELTHLAGWRAKAIAAVFLLSGLAALFDKTTSVCLLLLVFFLGWLLSKLGREA